MLRRRIQSSPRLTFARNIVSVLAIIAIVYIVIDRFILQNIQDKKNKEGNKKECLAELNRQINGVVADAYYDDNINVKAFVIYFTNGQKYITPIFIKSLNGYIKEGDSLYKASSTFKFKVFEKGSDSSITFEDIVNCAQLKYQ